MLVEVNFERPAAGHDMSRTIMVDGEIYTDYSMHLSKKLTETTADNCIGGIFSSQSDFHRGEAFISTLDFGFVLKMYNYDSATDFVRELKRRIRMVEEAFKTKYPLCKTYEKFMLPLS